MNRGLFAGLKPTPLIPHWAGGLDPVKDGQRLYLDSTKEGGIVPKAVSYASAKRTTGSYVLNQTSNTTWYDLDTALDLVLSGCAAGDLVMAFAAGLWSNEAPVFQLDVATIVGGAVVNYFATAGGTGDDGIFPWSSFPASNFSKIGGGYPRTLVAADLAVDGSCTFRLRYRPGTASSNKTLFGTAPFPFTWWVENRGR